MRLRKKSVSPSSQPSLLHFCARAHTFSAASPDDGMSWFMHDEPAHTDVARESRDEETEVVDEGGGDDDDDGMGELLSRLWVSEAVQGSPGSPIAAFQEEIPEEVRCPRRFVTVIQHIRVSGSDRMLAEDHLFLFATCMMACPKGHSVLSDGGL